MSELIDVLPLELVAEELANYSIYLACPMYGGQCSGFFAKSLADLTGICAKHGIHINHFFMFNESLVQRARNYCVDSFLRSDYSHLMFIDSDIGFNPMQVLTMLAIQIKHPEHFDVLAAPYPKKSIAWEKVAKAVNVASLDDVKQLEHFAGDLVLHIDPSVRQYKLNQPVPLMEAGTGFMLIPRYVFERFAEAHPEQLYRPDHTRLEGFDGAQEIVAYFDCKIDPSNKRYLSEDYYFCHEVRKLGMKLHGCPWMELMHVGSYVYRGSMAAMASIDVPLTADKKTIADSESMLKRQPTGNRKARRAARASSRS